MTSPLASLPTEIILEIIPHISYTSHALASFCMTCARFNSIVRAHEYSLVHAITQRQFPPTTLALFPGLSGQADCCVTSQSSSNEDEVSTEAEPAAGPLPTTRPITLPHAHVLGPQTFADLSTLHARLDTLHEIHSHWLQIVNHGPDLQWLKGRWENIHKAGLLLLYRLQDAGRRPASYFSSSSSGLAPPDAMQTYIAQLELLHALPGPSLACLLFKLLASIRILRVHGPTPIHATTTWGASIDPAQQRQDIELACEESLLKHGPAFFVALLRDGQASLGIKSRTRSWAVKSVPLFSHLLMRECTAA